MTRMTKAEQQDKLYRELAAAIADQAQIIADGTGSGPLYARVQLLKSNVEVLESWTPDDRSGMASSQDEHYGADGPPLPRGRCDTCGAPCSPGEGDCTADPAHETALS
jgi:hypothetical protein